MNLTALQKNDIRMFSRGGLVQEACGFVLRDGRVVRCLNTHSEPANAFQIDPEAFARADSEHGIAAVWHSHANLDGFSPEDQAAIRADGELPWIVYCLRTDDFHVVDPLDRGPLVGRTFCYGVLDCYSLVRDALEERHGVAFPEWPRGNWGEWGRPDFTVFDAQAGEFCRQIGKERLLPGDIVFLGKEHTSHIGILVDTDLMLHHLAGKRSRVEHYGEWWQARTRSLWRPAGCQPRWATVG